ncbi:MAG: class I SAM-dependent methyltransferase [Chloroflexota bacterium]|nr:class I SAM-dependent methyltransferase [Chloroflexota bacterium]
MAQLYATRSSMADDLPRLYTDLADWYHLLTDPSEYAEEAAFYFERLRDALGHAPRSVLELGCGGGNNAWHYKRVVDGPITLTDASQAMLDVSLRINPELEHVLGDMRTLRLGRAFEAVFVHDAVSYMTSLADLAQAMQTAFEHLRQGGVALFAPDHVREEFAAEAEVGGHDGEDGRALRYLEWTRDPNPDDGVYEAEFAYLLSEPGQPTRCVYDRHVCGLFSRADWLRLLERVGFRARAIGFQHSEVQRPLDVFIGVKG